MPSRRKILLFGLPYFGKLLADHLDDARWQAQYVPSRWLPAAAKVLTAHLLYLIGGRVKRYSKAFWLYRFLMFSPRRAKMVMHWVGSDVLHAHRFHRQGQSSKALVDGPCHLAVAPWLAAELKEIGIAARIQPFVPPELPATVPPLPEDFTVLAHLLPEKEAFYGEETIARLARELPQAKFLVAGGGRPAHSLASLPNVQQLGWVSDMASVYRRTSVLVRLTQHDGLSFMVLESLARGRYVVWSRPLAGAFFTEDYQEAANYVKHLWEQHRKGLLGLNEEGIRVVNQHYHPSVIRENLQRLFDTLLGEGQ